jgi:creatinine amidohydrolase
MDTRWLYVTSEELPKLREESKGVCVIPMGCVEKHGLHLPLGTDILHSSAIAYEASKLETFTVFPDFIFGDVPENYPNMPAGSITLPVETQMLLLEQLCEQIARHGYKKIVLFNGHGGNNPWLTTFLRKVENKPHDYVVAKVMLQLQAPHMMAEAIEEKGAEIIPEMNEDDIKLIQKYHEEKMQIGHGGMGETSYIMGLYPETVHLDRLGIESGLSTHAADKFREHGISIRDGGWFVDRPYAYSGHDPIGCNERIGKAAVRLEAERLAATIKFIKEDEDLIKWHNANWNTNI